MILSMTGFGRGESSSDICNFSVEIKSVNHRYNDIIVRMPKHLVSFEESIKKIIKESISRGRTEVYIVLEITSDEAIDININNKLALSYKTKLEGLMEELNIKDSIKLNHIIGLPDLVKIEKTELEEDILWFSLKEALNLAIKNLIDMRIQEGKQLKDDLMKQVNNITSILEEIKDRAPYVVVEYKERLEERLSNLLENNNEVDEERLSQEIVLFADKSDINEEVIRLYSHIEQFLFTLDNSEAKGRKLDFIIQEMNREINTIGSKANDLIITRLVVEIKSDLERLREQVQNIE